MKKLLFLLLLFPILSNAQLNLDSLWGVWNDEAQSDTNRLKAMDNISWKGYLFTQPDSAFYFAQLLIDFAKEKGQKKHIANGFNTQGVSFYFQSDYDKAIFYFTKSLNIQEEIGDKSGVSGSLNNIGLIYKNQGDYDKAIDYYTKSFKLSEESGDKTVIAASLNNIGAICQLQGDYDKAIDYFTQSLKIQEAIGNKRGVSSSLSGIGTVYNDQGDYIKAIDFHTQSLKIYEEIGYESGIASSLNNIGAIYYVQVDYDKAIDYYTQSLNIVEGIGDKSGIAKALNNIGGVYSDQGDYDKAMDYYTKSLKIKEEIGKKTGIASSLNNIGAIYKAQGNYAKALDYGKRSLALAQELGHAIIIRDAAKSLWDLNKKIGKSKEGLEMYELYIATRDSIVSESNQKSIMQQGYKYAYEKQADSIAIEQVKKDELGLAEEKRKEDLAFKESEKKNFIIWAGAGGLCLVLIFTFFIVNRLRITRKQKAIIEQQKIEVEEQKSVVEKARDELGEKNKEIMDSITYAKRIQSAILPSQKLVKQHLQKSFILYKPKDIVAGDFYWMEHRQNKVLFAAADCTGHGVPGAMVSVVCNNGLNRSVREHGLTDPGQILDKTREIVIAEFEKSEDEVKDGMDIAICSLEGKTLKYAGAHNPLWIIRNGEVLETKANKQPIGKFDKQLPFTTHTFELEKGDSIYIFTDGFVDQFGGEKSKKFKVKAFRSLLLSIQDKRMGEQKQNIDDAFETWKGDIEQVDDVCIIGVKI